MQVRITGSANLAQAKAEFAALQAQVNGLNAAMAASSKIPQVNPAGYQKLTGAVAAGSQAFRNSLASTGAFRVEQMRLNSATSHYTDLLQRQKLSFRDLRKNSAVMKAAYKEQLAAQQMVVRSAEAAHHGNKGLWDVATPRLYAKEVDTVGKRLNWLGQQWKSAGTQMVNFGKNTQWAGRQLTVGFTMPMVAVGIGAGVMAYKINKEMTRIKKVYNTTADQSIKTHEAMAAVTQEFAKLEADAWNTAANAAKQYGASATDTLGVQAELAATGQKGAKLQSATTEVMKSAMLGEIDYQTATTATIALQQQLHLSTRQLSDSWAYMNSVENATSLQMKDFAQAIPIALGPIRQMGGDLQDLGTIMTAMVSRGIQVGKAANAIKALPQRLSRPSKKVQEEFKSLTGQDIMELNKKNPNNIIGLLTSIENAVKHLDTLPKRKVLAGLFGTFQLSTMNAMLDGMNDLQKGVGQVTKAQEIGQQSTKAWAQVSSQEIKQYQKSASGQFKIMVENLKVQAAKLGEPFLEVATKVGTAVTGIIEAFNHLPKAMKILIAAPLVLAAIAGPALMLVGLFYNLSGNAVRLAGSILSAGKAMVIMTKEERAMAKAHIEERAAMESTTGQIQTEAYMLEMLSKANTEAERSTMAFALAQRGVNPQKITTALGAQTSAQERLTAATAASSEALYVEAQRLEALAVAERRRTGTTGGPATQRANEAMYVAAKAEDAERSTAKQAVSSGVVASNTAKTGRAMDGAAVAGAAMGTSMALMTLNSNETLNSIGQIMMISSLLIPSFKGAALAVKAVGSAAWVAAVRAESLKGGMLGAAAGARAFGAAVMTAMGPVGWVLAAVTAIGVVAYKLWKHEQKITAEKEKQNRLMSKQNTLLNDSLGIDRRRMKSFHVPSPADLPHGPTTSELADQLKGSSSGRELVKTYKSGSSFEKDTMAAQIYIDALQSVGGNAKKAQAKVEALFLASGKGALDAQEAAQKLFDTLGTTIDPQEEVGQWKNQVKAVLDETDKSASDTGKEIGTRLMDAIVRAGPDSAQEFMDSMQSIFDSQWNNIFNKLSPEMKTSFKQFGIDSGKEFNQAAKDQILVASGQMSSKSFNAKYNIKNAADAAKLAQTIQIADNASAKEILNAQAFEKATIRVLTDKLHIKQKIATLDELSQTFEFKIANANKQTVNQVYTDEVKKRQESLDLVQKTFGINVRMTNEEKLALARVALKKAGLKDTNNLLVAEARLAKAAKDNLHDGSENAKKVADQLHGMDRIVEISLRFKNEDLQTVRKAGMTGVMEDMANAASETFDNRMNAALDASQKGWDQRIAANDAAAQRASTRLDAKWERIHNASDAKWERRKDAMNNFYDKRINAVDRAIKAEEKAEDIRQRIFEAEKTRIERLTDMANKNIDFNVAINTGNLDEAAKIRNDVAAQQADWALSDAANASSASSQSRIDKMNNRKDVLGNQKDAALKQLEANEKAANAALDRREKREKAHLEHMTQMRADALKAQADADMASQRKKWDYEKKTNDARLELFKSYIARNKKDLERWMHEVGLSYDDFGIGVKGKGEKWSKWFQDSMTAHMRKAGKEIQSDNMWAAMGHQARSKMLNAMGFKNMREFQTFIKSGNLPANFNTRDLGGNNSGGGGGRPRTPTTGGVHGHTASTAHSGGEVGSVDNRVGVARTLKGLHPSETWLRAQKGEFVVNRRDAKENADLLQQINSGQMRTDSPRNIGMGVGGPSTTAGLMSAFMARGMAAGIAKGMQNAFQAKKRAIAQMSMAGATFSAGRGGMFGDREFSGAQLKNAAIIASVGSNMGMSKRDIEIGIMTAITESGLVNIHGGDRDSQGLFQQRPSMGWGTVAQVTDPEYAARKFFSVLRGVPGRNNMSPWMEAQSVQRSAFSDGSNYRQYWDEAIAIFNKGLKRSASGTFTASGGSGGRHRASVPGKGWSTPHDYRNGLGSPLFAIDDGRIVESRAITSGGSPGNGAYATPYRSYGETILYRTNDGITVRMAHLNPGQRAPVGRYKGGALIGRSGMTGNASGPHTHFEVNGSTDARGAFQRLGIGLETGGYLTREGMANLHKDEVVVSPDKTKDLYKGLDTFSSFMDSVKNVGFGSGGEPLGAAGVPMAGISRLFGIGLASRSHSPASGSSSGAAATSSGAGGSSNDGNIDTGSNKPDSGRRASVNTASFNTWTGSNTQNTMSDLSKLMRIVSVIAMSEVGNKGGLKGLLAKRHWGFYNGGHETGLAWNKDVLDALKLSSFSLNPHHSGRAGLMHRYAAYGLFSQKGTGRQFYQVSLHTVPHLSPGHTTGTPAQRHAIEREQHQNMQKLFDRLRGTGKPVIMGGDINRSTNNFKGAYYPGGRRTYMNLASVKGGTSRHIGQGAFHSDSPAVISRFNLPALKSGGYTMSDGMAMLHKKEVVVDPERTKMLHDGIERFASGSNAEYNLHMHIHGGNLDEDAVVTKTIRALGRMEERKPQPRNGRP